MKNRRIEVKNHQEKIAEKYLDDLTCEQVWGQDEPKLVMFIRSR